MREILGFSGARPDEAPNAASGLVRRQARRCGVSAAPERRHAQRAKGLRGRPNAQIWRHCARAAHFAAQQPDCHGYLCHGRRAFGAKIPEKARQGLTAPALRGMMQQKGGGGLVSVWAAPTHRFYRPTPTKRVFCCVEGSSRILGRLFAVAGTAIYLWRARTQQNKNFVALCEVMCYNRGRNGCGQKNEALMCNAYLEAAAVRPSSKSVSSAVSASR